MAAVLFTDVVGSTARDRRMGPKAADEMRQSHLGASGDVVEQYDGRVIKSLGDGLLSVFSSPSSAVDAAVDLQQQCARLGQGQADPLQLRVGISAGEVSFDANGDCFGLAVVEAARLCAAAEPGQVLVGDLARRLCASSRHPFRALGPRSLKGIDAPVEVSVVEWRPSVAGRTLDLRAIDTDPELRSSAPRMLDCIGRATHMRRVRDRLLELLAPGAGETVLDVGSGTGEDVLELRQRVGPSGRVVGLDGSETMTREARRRAADAGVDGVEFVHGDATALEFADATFDGARCDRVFQYLLEPERAVHELARVIRPGGCVVIADTDWDTAVLDSPDEELTARINAAWTASHPNGRSGQKLYRLCKEAGLVDVAVEGVVQIQTELDDLYRNGVLPTLAEAAVEAKSVTPEEASRWLATIELADSQGLFLRAFTTFIVVGHVP
jgi:class 3 adenylate cyclase/ubiquinone/menaquinone biosynthesis C-methylase UbiE